jgi:hypothetical protein
MCHWMVLGLQVRHWLPCFCAWRDACQPLSARQDRPYCGRTVASRAHQVESPAPFHLRSCRRSVAAHPRPYGMERCSLFGRSTRPPLRIMDQGTLAGTRSSSSSSHARIILTPCRNQPIAPLPSNTSNNAPYGVCSAARPCRPPQARCHGMPPSHGSGSRACTEASPLRAAFIS